MSDLFSKRERWFIGTLYGVPIACLLAALAAAFNHAQAWAGRHSQSNAWEHLAFAVMIELPALFGLILMTLWPKIGGGRKPLVPRLLFGLAVVLSMYVQQAYAGADASGSERFVAGAPSVLAGAFLELVFWVMGLVEEAREKARQEAAGPPPAAVVPPPPMLIPQTPIVPVPPAAPPVSSPQPTAVPRDSESITEPVSPWTSPPGTPFPERAVPQDSKPDVPSLSTPGQGDKPQATALVPPPVPPSAGGDNTGGQDLPDTQDTDALTPTVSGGRDPQDNPEGDSAPEGDSGQDTDTRDGGTPGLDPVDLEVWEHHQKGMSKKELAAKYGCSEKTIQRRLGKVRTVIETTPAEEETANA